MSQIVVRSSLRVLNGELDYQSRPPQFTGSMKGKKGPSPGTVVCSKVGTLITFPQLTVPGYCRLQNLDNTNRVDVGIFDMVIEKFLPVMEILPGESYVIRLSRNIADTFGTGSGSGTGHLGAGSGLMVKAFNAPVAVLIEAFDS